MVDLVDIADGTQDRAVQGEKAHETERGNEDVNVVSELGLWKIQQEATTAIMEELAMVAGIEDKMSEIYRGGMVVARKAETDVK